MRSSSLLMVLALLFVALSFAPVVRGDTNLTLFQDAQCSQPLGEPLSLPFSSSSKCQTVPDQAVSFILYCAPDGGNTNFSFSIFNSTTDCSGDATIAITSDGTTASCATATITFQGQTVPGYIKVACDSSAAAIKPQHHDEDDMEDLMEDVIEDIEEYVEKASRKAHSKRTTVNNIIKLLKGGQ